jgi:hypothetical protein
MGTVDLTTVTATEPRSGRWKAVALAGGASASIAAVLLVNPNRGLVPTCPLKFVTGLDCPLCGGTRAAHALFTGDVSAAIDFNVLATFVILPLMAVLLVRAVVRLWCGKPVTVPVPNWAAVTALVLFGVIRNLPFGWAEPLRA